MARTKKVKAPMNDDCTTADAVAQSGSDDGTVPESTNEGNTMTTELDAVPEGYTHTVNPTPDAAKTKQEIAAEKAQAKVAAKAAKEAAKVEKAAQREAAKAEKAAASSHLSEEAKAAKAAAHAERQARIAALAEGRKYSGEMLSLADRVKQGAYVKSATGQLRSTDALAEALDAVPVMNVIALAKEVLGLDENPYSRLNTGQQSMNLRNKMRGAISKGILTIETIKEIIDREGYATAAQWAAEKAAKKAEREAKMAAAKAEREAKATAAAAVKAAKATQQEAVAA